MIALLCSVQAEAELLAARTAVTKTVVLGSTSIIEGTLAGRPILLCVGGMGKVNAAHAATLLLTRYDPEALLVFGVGGAYPSSGAKVGDIALAKQEIAGDEGVLTVDGFKDAEYIGIPLLKTATAVIYTTYPASEPLLKQLLQTLVSHKGSCTVHVGSFVTLSACTGTSARARELEERYHGLCENMEGAAAAQVAELHGVPWLEVRGISNIVEDRNLKKWDIPKAAAAAQEAVLRMLEDWPGNLNERPGNPKSQNPNPK
jgi:futalosine hydrolase